MRMPLSLEMRFEVEDHVDLGFHQYRSRYRKPANRTAPSCLEQDTRRLNHRALRPTETALVNIRRSNDHRHKILQITK